MEIRQERLVCVPIKYTAYCEKCNVEMERELRQHEKPNCYYIKQYRYYCPVCGQSVFSEWELPKIDYVLEKADK